jgi:GNAT superfamily N-acetyltransferase
MRIELLESPADLQGVTAAADFGAIVRSPFLLETMARNLASGSVIAAALDGSQLRGYATVAAIEPLWRRFAGLAGVKELGAIEVARSARRRGVASALLARLDRHAPLADLVLLTYGSSSHWEPDVSGLEWAAYRRMLVRLLGRAQFVIHDTDDPEIFNHPPDFLAIRFGANASATAMSQVLSRLYEEPARALTG